MGQVSARCWKFINDFSVCDYDPLVKMAMIHHQFESIHPFYDGNGRTGRIINILYLIQEGLLTVPILYLSNYIIKNKRDYYRLLQQIRDKESWEEWLLFMINGIQVTSRETIEIIAQIKALMFVVNDLKVSRITAANYLNKLADDGLLKKARIGTGNYYINDPLYKILSER